MLLRWGRCSWAWRLRTGVRPGNIFVAAGSTRLPPPDLACQDDRRCRRAGVGSDGIGGIVSIPDSGTALARGDLARGVDLRNDRAHCVCRRTLDDAVVPPGGGRLVVHP